MADICQFGANTMDLVRVWPIVAGSPSFVEPSLAGRAEQLCSLAGAERSWEGEADPPQGMVIRERTESRPARNP